MSALLAAAALAAIPPLPEPPPPADYYDPEPQREPVFPPRGRAPPADPIGDVWEMEEVAGWTGVWLRRGSSPTFDAYWTHPGGERVRATLQIWASGRDVVVSRRHAGGKSCRYEGTLSPDWGEVEGHYTCSWERTPMPWRARIVRMADVTPALLRPID